MRLWRVDSQEEIGPIERSRGFKARRRMFSSGATRSSLAEGKGMRRNERDGGKE